MVNLSVINDVDAVSFVSSSTCAIRLLLASLSGLKISMKGASDNEERGAARPVRGFHLLENVHPLWTYCRVATFDFPPYPRYQLHPLGQSSPYQVNPVFQLLANADSYGRL